MGDEACRRRDRRESRYRTRQQANEMWLSGAPPLDEEPGDGRKRCGQVGVEKRQRGDAIDLSSLPALKPYQPNHSSPVPSAIKGMLCGVSTYFRLPT